MSIVPPSKIIHLYISAHQCQWGLPGRTPTISKDLQLQAATQAADPTVGAPWVPCGEALLEAIRTACTKQGNLAPGCFCLK